MFEINIAVGSADRVQASAGELVTLTPVGENFIRWEVRRMDNNAIVLLVGENSFIMPDSNVICVAIYDEVPETVFTITWRNEDGSVFSTTQDVAEGSVIVAPTAPQIDGKTFLRWEGFTEGMLASDDHIFTAVYQDIQVQPTSFTVTFMSLEVVITTQTINAGSIIEIQPLAPTRTGYKFTGWFLGDELWDFDNPITEDITLVAGWEENGSGWLGDVPWVPWAVGGTVTGAFTMLFYTLISGLKRRRR
jgi:uncharacterized repeat protein (TIGR02543 family)